MVLTRDMTIVLNVAMRESVQFIVDGHVGGKLAPRGPLNHMLKNPIYLGKIIHKGKVFEGQHPAIIDEATWDKAQRRLKDRTERYIKTRRGSSQIGVYSWASCSTPRALPLRLIAPTRMAGVTTIITAQASLSQRPTRLAARERTRCVIKLLL